MKNFLLALLILVIPISAIPVFSQANTKILLIGNSFMGRNNMIGMLGSLAQEANMPIDGIQYINGGYDFPSDVPNDPNFFKNISSKKWDYVVLQDNQGQFVLDSGQLGVGAMDIYREIYDSVKANNPCTRIIWFAGWAWKNGRPSDTSDTGENCIKRILYNIRMINDELDEIVCPIGQAWLSIRKSNPGISLWDAQDNAHPTLLGSYLTASTLFCSIFKTDLRDFKYTGGVAEKRSGILRNAAYKTVFKDSLDLDNLNTYTIDLDIQGNMLTVTGKHDSYEWFFNGNLISGEVVKSLVMTDEGTYWVEAPNSEGCTIQSLGYVFKSTSVKNRSTSSSELSIYPNPADGFVIIKIQDGYLEPQTIEIYDLLGNNIPIDRSSVMYKENEIQVDISSLKSGVYFAKIVAGNILFFRNFIVN